MLKRQTKTGYFALTGMNTIAASYFFNYLFFFLRDHLHFGNKENLSVSALHGLVYAVAAWQCGKFAERRGFFLSLKLGFAGLALIMVLASFLHTAWAFFLLVAGYTVVLLLTWPALEALISEGESRTGTQRVVGLFNCSWAGAAAFAYFTGGRLYDALGKGAIFWLPAGIFAFQFALASWMASRPRPLMAISETPILPVSEASSLPARLRPQVFLKMAWLANPFAYIAINTLLAVMPGVAQKLSLTPTQTGLFGSVWFFGRLFAFILFWKWTGWHYRFRWLLAAFLLLIGSFTSILIVPKLWMVVVAQVVFGLATGLIYYSSLFYAMDVGETKGEHGGLHEAFIGAGIFLGPAVGAAALHLAPENPNAGTWAVTALLGCGLVGLLGLRLWNRNDASPQMR